MANNFEEKITKLQGILDKMDVNNDPELLKKVAKGLGPALYNLDASKVSCSDPKELETVVNNYGVKKLGQSKEKAEAAVQAVCEQYKSERTKYRAVFYYLVCKELGCESHYD